MVNAADLLAWYGVNARELPWRIGPHVRGVRPDPYRIWLSEVMLQQTTVAAVKAYFERFVTLWPTVDDLAGAPDDQVMGEWAGLGYYARARNLLKCARVVAAAGAFPDTYDELIKLPGIGPYTAAAVAAIAFGRPAVVVDGNVERVMARVFDIHTPLPAAKPELTALAARLTPTERSGDYAQAVMDLGATICTPKSPSCGVCPWQSPCAAFRANTVSILPKKTPKKPKPTRVGVVYVARRSDGAYLLERRPDKGLLGGMRGWPGAAWADVSLGDPDGKIVPEKALHNVVHDAAPITADWRKCPVDVRHTFTHFHLRLEVQFAQIDMGANPHIGEFLTPDMFRASDLPTVMRKAFDAVQGAFLADVD